MNGESRVSSFVGILILYKHQYFDQCRLTIQILYFEFKKLNQNHIWKYKDPRIGKILLREIKMWEELPYQISKSIIKL